MAFDISKYTEASREPDAVRDIGTITTEILRLKQDAGNAILSIGQRLIEAKAMLPHGEGLPWLTEQVEFAERTGRNFMRLAREWTNRQALADLGAAKALTLLALPPEERERFMEENHVVDGEEKSVIDMTSRELEKAVKERDEALHAAEAARAAAETADQSRAKMEADMTALKQLHQAAQAGETQAREALAKAQAELKALREKPVEVAARGPPGSGDPDAGQSGQSCGGPEKGRGAAEESGRRAGRSPAAAGGSPADGTSGRDLG